MLSTGLPLPGRADSETTVRAEVGPKDVFKLVGELQRTGTIPVTLSGAIRLPSRVVYSGSVGINLARIGPLAGYDRLRALWIYATLNNISDVAVRDALFFPQPGRSGYIGTEIEW